MASTYQAPQAAGYTAGARAFHWITAALVLTLIPLGLIMTRMPDGAAKVLAFDLHRSLGIIVLPIAILRLIYRLRNPPPPLPADIPAIQKLAAEATHHMLYAALIIQPLLGWVGMSAFGEPIRVLWLFDVPRIWGKDEGLSETLFMFHKFLGFAMAGMLGAHIGGALFHHFIRRDNILMRMVRG